MNILLIISKNDRYGAQRIFIDQVRILSAMKNNVIVAGRGGQGFVPDTVRALGVEYHGLPLKGLNDLVHLRRLVKQRAVDVIHTTLDRADYFGVLLSMITRVPVVSTMMVPRYHPGFRFADAVTVLSQKLCGVLLAKGIKRDKIRIIRPGIDVARFVRPDAAKKDSWSARLGVNRYSTVFCHVASLIPRKGHQISLELMASLKKRGEAPLLVIIGDPLTGEYYDSLQAQIARLHLKENVYFTGWTADTAEIMSLCHMTLLPSENEALGIVLMEGMAAGTPIVARRAEGGAELIDEFGTGYLYEPDRPVDELAGKIHALRSDAHQFAVWSDKCRTIGTSEFSLERFGSRLMNLYVSLAGQSTSRQ